MTDYVAAPAVIQQPQIFQRGCLACGSPDLEYLGLGESADYCNNCCPPLCPCGGGTATDCSRREQYNREREEERNRPSELEMTRELFETDCSYARARELYVELQTSPSVRYYGVLHAHGGVLYTATMGGSSSYDESIQFTASANGVTKFARPNGLTTEICAFDGRYDEAEQPN